MRIAEAENAFLGLKWGLGLGFSRGWDANVNEAELVNGTVRAKSDLRDQPRAVFEFHKYLWHNAARPVTRGVGPFVAAAASNEKVLSGVGLGVMVGARSAGEKESGFSLG
ncbi:MAG: hypothetical protein IPK85_00280 [Gemmatimonadetes bacterium]|nr:hypothetical protein [Gemmatimonadota bacterium]